MSSKKQQSKKAEQRAGRRVAVAEIPQRRYWPYFLGGFVALVLAFWVYEPALSGPFLFDDRYLPFGSPTFPVDTFLAWLKGVRPVLMVSYWVNFQISQYRPSSYHALNVIFHALNSGLIFLVARKILQLAEVPQPRQDLLSIFAGALFLLHPVNTEAVAYVASRSENLSVLFFLAAWTVFLYRPAAETTWVRAITILAIFGAAALTKEHTIVLPTVLLLTDYFWNSPFSFEGIRRNWRLYAPTLVGGILAAVYVVRLVRGNTTIGAGIKDFTWYQYFFTQCRAFWVYIRLFVLPVGLRIDYDFPISRSILDHGAVLGLAAILAVAGAAFYYRKRCPLAAYGFFTFVILMAPTSSFVPIKDLIAERRLYLSMIGLLFIALEFLRRVDVKQKAWMAALAGVLVLAGVATYIRSFVWSDPRALWEDAVAKSPGLARDQFQLAEAYREQGDCAKALPHYSRSAELDSRQRRHSYWYPSLFIDWGLAYDCLNREDEALAKFHQAVALKPTAHAYSQIGMVYGKQKKNLEALDALQRAQHIDPSFVMTYVYMGGVRQNMGDLGNAIASFRHALALDPHNEAAFQSLQNAEAALANRQ